MALGCVSHDLSTSLLAKGFEIAAVNIALIGQQSTVWQAL